MAFKDKPKNSWQLLNCYWRSNKKGAAYSFIIAVLILTIVLVGFDVIFTYWMRYFYNALQEYNKQNIVDLLKVFLFIAGVYIILAVNRFYLQQILGVRWRKWLTQKFLGEWLTDRNYYYLETFDHGTDNPDQRISEDIKQLVLLTLALLIGLIEAVTTLVAFIYILWMLSAPIMLHLGSYGEVHIPGYLVWAALIYAVVGTFLTVKIGRPLVPLQFEQQRREANFRFSLVNIRSHAEHVALFRGEAHEDKALNRVFNTVLENWYFIIWREKMLLWFTAGYNQISVIFPIIVCLPGYLSKSFKLGGLMQILSVFAKIQTSLSFIVNSYTTIAEWQAIKRRLMYFLDNMIEMEETTKSRQNFKYEFKDTDDISVHGLNIQKPDEAKLMQQVNLTFKQGHDYLIKGISGIGKSTLIRTIAGIWPFGSGEVTLPKEKRIMYLPQKPYMPLGSLRQAILFPNDLDITDDAIKSALESCQLSQLTSRLDDTQIWSQVLSPGEQQRLSFARVLLQKPDWAFLDESTSALDHQNETLMYRLLKDKCPNCSIVSVGHRITLDELHDEIVDVSRFA